MTSEKYQFEIVTSNQRQLAKVTDIQAQTSWVFYPSKFDVKIKWHCFNAHGHLLLLDSKAKIRLYDPVQQKMLDTIELKTEFRLHQHYNDTDGWLVIYTDRAPDEDEDNKRYKKYIYIVDINKFILMNEKTVEFDYEYVDNSYDYHEVSQYLNFKYYLPYQDEIYGDEDDEVVDGYGIVDLMGKTVEQYTFPNHPYFQHRGDDVCTASFAPWFDLGLRPDYQNIPVIKDGENEMFAYVVEIFRLSTGEQIKTIPVREIPSTHIDYPSRSPSEKPEDREVVRLLRDAEVDKRAYRKAHDNFFEDLYHVVWEKGEKAFWVLFRGGILRRVDINGKRSPLIVSRDHRKNSSEEDILGQFYNHTNLLKITEDNEVIFGSNSQYDDEVIKFNPDEYDLSNEDEVLDLPNGLLFKRIKESDENYDSLTLNIIHMESWGLEQCKKAIKEVLNLVQDDIESLVIGYQVEFYFELGDERLDDEAFYERLVPLGEDITESLIELIECFIRLPNSESYYHNEETTLFHYAMKTLVTIDSRYIDLFIRYIASVDLDHEIYNSELLYNLIKDGEWDELRAKLVFSGYTNIGCSYTYDLLAECWEDMGLKEYINNNYTASKLKALYNDIFSLTKDSFDRDDIESRLEEFETYKENKVLIECLRSL